jgi:hypothetical protein
MLSELVYDVTTNARATLAALVAAIYHLLQKTAHMLASKAAKQHLLSTIVAIAAVCSTIVK